MRSTGLLKAKRIIIIGLSTIALFIFMMYGIFSCTLLNPDFYHHIFETEAVTASFNKASETLTAGGAFLFSGPSLKENAYGLVEGVLRFIHQKDMSLSSIQLEEENTETIRTAVLSAVPDGDAGIPQISRIHPFVVSYFMPGTETIFSTLQSLQEGFAFLQTLVPFLGLIGLITLLLPDKAAENTRLTLVTTGILLIGVAFALFVLQKTLLLSPLSEIFPDAEVFIGPIVHKMTDTLFIVCTGTGGVLLATTPVMKLPQVKKAVNHYSRIAAVVLIVLTGMVVILFNNEVFATPLQTMKLHEQAQVKILSQNENTVHSLIIKLREDGTEAPIINARLTLVCLDKDVDPVSAVTDVLGNARFILPQGRFILYTDASTINRLYYAFEPVVLNLDQPDSSWYTFYLTRNENFRPDLELQDEGDSIHHRRQVPLLK